MGLRFTSYISIWGGCCWLSFDLLSLLDYRFWKFPCLGRDQSWLISIIVDMRLCRTHFTCCSQGCLFHVDVLNRWMPFVLVKYTSKYNFLPQLWKCLQNLPFFPLWKGLVQICENWNYWFRNLVKSVDRSSEVSISTRYLHR